MNILKDHVKTELIVKGSRFVSELFPCSEQSEARSLIKNQKARYADSTHVVHAFVLGLGGEILGMSDDGEPGGTAGRPALDVLKGHDCTNTLLTITRWFGGTLLGTGGLVKAYGDCAKQVLAAADSSFLFVPYVARLDFYFECDYTLYQTVKRFLETLDVVDISENFGAYVSVGGKIASDEYTVLAGKLKDISNGKIIL